MAATCLYDGCKNTVFSNKYCKIHGYLRIDKKWLESKNKPKKVTPIKSSNKPIKKVSTKQAVELKKYKIVRIDFLESHPVCQAQLPGCGYHATQIHHKMGRIGSLLYDSKYFLASCYECHVWIENNCIQAKELGFSLDRLNKKENETD